MNSGFPFRAKISRWLMAGVVALWALGSTAMPLMPMAECRDMAPTACMDQMHHAAMPHHTPKQAPAQNHECCKKKPGKPAPKKADMPACPTHDGLLPRTCGATEMSCCPVLGREETRRTAKVENSKNNESPVLADARIDMAHPVRVERTHTHLRDGLRFEKPVFDLKTDLRV